MKGLKNVFVAVGSFLLIGLFVVAVAPVQASEVTDRILALEKELTQLKGEQVEMREMGRAARAKLPSFKYRGGSGLSITAGDKSWAIKFGSRLQPYMTFWLDDSYTAGGTPQGVMQVRRFRPYTRWYLKNGFYELRQSNDGNSNIGFDAEMFIHFEKLNPWFPTLGYGATPSLTLNPQSHNLSSKRAGRSEQPFLENATGLTTGSPNRGILVSWKKLPRLGNAKITFLNVGVGVDRAGEFDYFGGNITTDGKSIAAGIGLKPFDKTRNKWLKNLELSFGTMIQKVYDEGAKSWTVEANQLRGNRIEFIKTTGGDADMFHYYTPGIGWKYGPLAVHMAANFANTHQFKAAHPSNIGGLIKGRGFRLLAELWLYSAKKGMFTGSTSKGGLMLSPMFQRASVDGGRQHRMTGCGTCKSAHATNAGIALWYYFPGKFFNIGAVWDRWAVVNMNTDMAADIFNSKGGKVAGGKGSFNTLTLVTRFHW